MEWKKPNCPTVDRFESRLQSPLRQCFFFSKSTAFRGFLYKKEIKMAAMHPAVIWLIIAAIVGTALLIATFIANRNQKKKKKGKYFIILGR